MEFIYKLSKKVHLYSALFLSLFILWMAASGILLNHSGLISSISLPINIMPSSYEFKNWNRYAFRDAVFFDNPYIEDMSYNNTTKSEKTKITDSSFTDSKLLFICGKQGVWQSCDKGASFQSVNQGFPESAWLKDTLCLLSEKQQNYLYAGTRQGLWVYDLAAAQWREIKELDGNNIVSLVQKKTKIYAFTPSHCFVKDISKGEIFQKIVLKSDENQPGTMFMIRFFLSLHDGSVLGLPGKLLVDSMAVTMIFFTLSGFYLWIVSKNIKRFKGKKRIFELFSFCRRYHLKFGIWCSVFLIIIIFTGTIIKPPFRQFVHKTIGRQITIPVGQINNPFKNRIIKAVFMPKENKILLSTKEGFYTAPASLDMTFTKIKIPVKVSGMGVSVLKVLSDSLLLIGSFKGCFLVDFENKSVKKQISTARTMVSGVLIQDDKLLGMVGYKKGFQTMDRVLPFSLNMPEKLVRQADIPLWYGLFELHNARIFKPLFKQNTWLIIPVGGILSLIIILSGCYDWYYIKSYRK